MAEKEHEMDLAELKEAGIRTFSDSLLSSIGFINELQEQCYENLIFICLDLLVKGSAPREQVDDYLTHLRSAIRQQCEPFTHCLGLIRTPPIKEVGLYRIQCVLIFDGERGRNAIQRGHEVGCYWFDFITEEQGSYFIYTPYRRLGLGCGCDFVIMGAMRWKWHMLLLAMGSADHPLILIGVPRLEAKDPNRH